MAFQQVVFGDFEGSPDILGANGDADTLGADECCGKVGVYHVGYLLSRHGWTLRLQLHDSTTSLSSLLQSD